MKDLINELRRRKVFRLGVSYLVVAWVAMQIVNEFFPPLGLPEWSQTLVAVLILIGFPFALLLAWAFELTPEGIKPDRPVSETAAKSQLVVGHPETKALIGLAVLIAGGAVLWYLATSSRDWAFEASVALALSILVVAGLLYSMLNRSDQRGAEDNAQSTVAASDSVELAPHESTEEISIAVLPFVNLSPDPDNEYFSDGMAEELLTVLARIQGWRVAARTSCFHFKGRNEKIQVVGEELRVSNVLEGSVRSVNNRIRVTAQLSKVDGGYQLWSETYDRTLDDVFQVQDEIAQAIVRELKGKLLGDFAATVPTSDSDAFRHYLQGRSMWQRRDAKSIARGIDLLQQAVTLDPQFARAYASLAAAYHKLPLYDLQADAAATQQSAETAAREALHLDPDVGEAYATLGSILTNAHQYAEANGQFARALAVEPNDTTAQHWYAVFLLNTGQAASALQQISKALRLDPLNGAIIGIHGCASFAVGECKAGIDSLQNAVQLGWAEAARAFLGAIYLHLGNIAEAESCLRKGRFGGERIPDRLISALLASGKGADEMTDAGREIVASVERGEISQSLGFRLSALIGSDCLFELPFDAQDISSDALGAIWYPPAAPVRDDRHFAALLERFNLPL